MKKHKSTAELKQTKSCSGVSGSVSLINIKLLSWTADSVSVTVGCSWHRTCFQPQLVSGYVLPFVVYRGKWTNRVRYRLLTVTLDKYVCQNVYRKKFLGSTLRQNRSRLYLSTTYPDSYYFLSINYAWRMSLLGTSLFARLNWFTGVHTVLS